MWKPPGAKSLGFHQDDAYCQWVVPSGYITVWIALDDTAADGGTLEYARGSHKWGVRPPRHAFHAPDDYRAAVREAAEAAGVPAPEIVPVEVPQRRARTLAVRWLVQFARQRREKTMSQRLANELIDAQQQQGGAYKRKDDIFRMAQANKAFAHYRW